MSFDIPDGVSAQNTPEENDRLTREHRRFGGISASEAVANLHANLKYLREDRPAELKKTRTSDPQLMARMLVGMHYYPELSLEEIYVVWFCSTLRNWKCLISTNVKDNRYYEVTHNGSIQPAETYIDQYTKTGHTSVQGDEIVHANLPKP